MEFPTSSRCRDCDQHESSDNCRPVVRMGCDSQPSSISPVGFERQCSGGWRHLHGLERTGALLTAFTSAQIDTLRDIRLFRLDKKRILVVSCDSAGAIGPKPIDRIRVSGYVVGKFTARVALMEALSVGALPFCVVVTLSVEPKPTGTQILRGVRSELSYASLQPPILLQSTEKNFRVRQTGVGVTVLSFASPQSLRIKKCKPGDVVMALGMPQLGEEVLAADRRKRVSDTRDVQRLLKIPFVHEIIPVGSQGILKEARTLAKDSRLGLRLRSELDLNVMKSAGPATVTLCTFPSSKSNLLTKAFGKRVSLIGMLR
jgi:hypothetical protein